MPKPTAIDGRKNLIQDKLKQLREAKGLSQRDLAHLLQLQGYDMDKNVITRIETNKRYVSDIELKALAQIFQISYEFLLNDEEK